MCVCVCASFTMRVPATVTLCCLLCLSLCVFTHTAEDTPTTATTTPGPGTLLGAEEQFAYSFGSQRVLLTERDLALHDIVRMRMAHGQDFECYVPKMGVREDEPQQQQQQQQQEEQQQSGKNAPSTTQDAGPGPVSPLVETDKLLSKYDGRCFLRKEGWWTYEYCHKGHVRQFHAEELNVVVDFSLGSYDAEETEQRAARQMEEDELEKRAQEAAERESRGTAGYVEATESGASEQASVPSRPASHMYVGGTPCDLNQQPRSTEVKFLCGPDAAVTNLMEPSTCHYQLDFSSPEMCQHKSFSNSRRARNVVCVPAELGHTATVQKMEARGQQFQRRSEPATSSKATSP